MNVDFCRHELVGRAGDPHVAAHGALGFLRHLLDELFHHRARDGRVVELAHRRAFAFDDVERRVGHEVRLDMVGVSVHAVFCVRDDHVWALLADQNRELAGGLVEPGLVERARVFVVRRVDHARISIAEEFQTIDTQDFCGRLQLFGPDLAESRPRRILVHVVYLAYLAARGGDEHDPMAV